MTKEEILEKLEEIQNNNDSVIGQNEYDLFVREDIANFIIQQTTEKNSEIESLKAEIEANNKEIDRLNGEIFVLKQTIKNLF